jgi:flavin reductase (DIM6/NTAB) family NADH-FMN oxidoreductase RutF
MKSFNTDGDFTENYKFLIGSILPRPIAVVSTLNIDGSNNLAPFSFFTAVSASPMIIGFSPMIRTSTGAKKDTVLNIERTKEFVVNFVTEKNLEKINETSSELPYGEDEFLHAGLTPLDSMLVAPRRLKESPIQFECKLRDILNYGDGVGSGRFITGEVVKVHVVEEILEQGRILTDKFAPVGRGAGNDWILCNNRIQIERKMKAQIQK